MSQQSHTAPLVTTGNRQQVNLRDYLNQRVAPFLKKAIHESLDSQAEYPLQWLGEHLIQQSILYEGNPDSTNIRERFVYKHDTPSPTTASTAPTTAPMDDMVQSNPVPSPKEPENAAPLTNGVSTGPVALDHEAGSPIAVTNVPEDITPEDTVPRDTEMGGTS